MNPVTIETSKAQIPIKITDPTRTKALFQDDPYPPKGDDRHRKYSTAGKSGYHSAARRVCGNDLCCNSSETQTGTTIETPSRRQKGKESHAKFFMRFPESDQRLSHTTSTSKGRRTDQRPLQDQDATSQKDQSSPRLLTSSQPWECLRRQFSNYVVAVMPIAR